MYERETCSQILQLALQRRPGGVSSRLSDSSVSWGDGDTDGHLWKPFRMFIWHLSQPCLYFPSFHFLFFCILCFYFTVSWISTFCYHSPLPSFPPVFLVFFAFLSSPLTELGQESVPASTHNATVVVSAAGVMPYLQGRAVGGDLPSHSTHSVTTTPSASSSSSSSSSSSTSCDNRQPAPPGTMVSAQLQGQSYSLGISNSGLGPPPPKPPGGVYTTTGQHNSSDSCPLVRTPTENLHAWSKYKILRL